MLLADWDDEDFEDLTTEEVDAIIKHGQSLLEKHASSTGTRMAEGRPFVYTGADQIKVCNQQRAAG